VAAGVAGIAVAAFAPAIRNGFIYLDDTANLVDNVAFRGLGLANVRWAFTTVLLGHWQPLAWLSFGLDWTLWGLRPAGYHLTNVLLHAANAVLVLLLARRLLARAGVPGARVDGGAALAALLWAVHPLRVESVAWATERRDVLSALFVLAALLAYVGEGRRRAAHAFALTVPALLAKASAMVMPALLVVLDVYPLGRLGGRVGWTGPAARRVWREKIPFLAAALVAAGVALAAQHRAGALRSLAALGVGPRVGAAMHGLGFYVWKLVLPVRLSPMYGYWPGLGPADPAALAAFATFLALLGAALGLRRRCPALGAALAWYAAAVAPTLGLAQSGPQVAADRYTYLAAIGWSVLAGGVIATAIGRPRRRLAVGAPLVVVLGVLTVVQTTRWRDARTLWSHALAVDPTSGFAWYRLADQAWRAGDVDGAIARYRRAAALALGFPELENDFAAALAAKGDFDAAFTHYRAALALTPRFALAHTSYGVALARAGRLADAVEVHHRALAIDPRLMEAHVNLGLALEELGRTDEALAEYRTALAIRPSAEAYSNLGLLLASTGRLPEAIDAFRRATALRPDLAVVRENLARALAAHGEGEAARRELEEALRRDPDRAPARRLLAELGDDPAR
jgi:tetratricopeptide (TPR) repeat protein